MGLPLNQILCGDSVEMTAEWPTGDIAVVTDPPYGIGFPTGKDRRSKGLLWSRGKEMAPAANGWKPLFGDDKPFDPSPWLRFPEVILWGGHNYSDRLPQNRGWLIWDKLRDKKPCDYGDCELAWTNLDMVVRVHRQLWRGLIREGEENVANGPKLHPSQKPVALMVWCIQFTKAPIILDPYCGSGTTCEAARRLGRQYIGIEIDEGYCQTARERIAKAS